MNGAIGIDWGDLAKWQGTIDLGMNATGVVHSRLHKTEDEIIIHEEMPAEVVGSIMAHVDKLRDRIRQRRPGGDLVGHIPIVMWYAWRREWQRGPKLHGVTWRAFFAGKFMDRDHSKFRAGNI